MYGRHDYGLPILQRHEEALQEARNRRLAKQARPDDWQPHGLRRVGLASGSMKRPTPVALVSVLLALPAVLLGTYGCSDGTPATMGLGGYHLDRDILFGRGETASLVRFLIATMLRGAGSFSS